MENPAEVIANAERLTRIFGYWPSFHDAEVVEFNLSRGGKGAELDPTSDATLTAKLYVFEMTSKVRGGHFVNRHHTLVTLRFESVDDLQAYNFNHQNALLGLSFEPLPRTEGRLPRLAVTFDSAYGLGATFTCLRAEVIEAEPCEAPKR